MVSDSLNIVIDLPFIILVVANVSLVGMASLLAWYSTRLLKKIYFITDTVGEVNRAILEYLNHLEKVHSMDAYYGDQTIQNLIAHSKDLKTYENAVAPINIPKIIAPVNADLSVTSFSILKLSLLFKIANIIEPIAPTPAASVGVA